MLPQGVRSEFRTFSCPPRQIRFEKATNLMAHESYSVLLARKNTPLSYIWSTAYAICRTISVTPFHQNLVDILHQILQRIVEELYFPVPTARLLQISYEVAYPMLEMWIILVFSVGSSLKTQGPGLRWS